MTTRTAADQDLLELAPAGILVTDDDGVVVSANAELLRMVGRSAEDVVGACSLSTLLTVGGRVLVETRLVELGGVVRELAIDLVAADGSTVPVLLNARRLGSGRSRAVQAVAIGAGDQHRYEEVLRESARHAEHAREDAATLAHTLQQTLIPPAPPSVPHLGIAAAYRPAGDGREVGGDFYDVFQVSDTGWVVVLGDVSGKGVHAATVTALVRHTVRTLAINHPDPADLLQGVDVVLKREDTDHYCTLVVVRLDQSDGGWDVRISLAGHPPALLRATDGSVTELGVPGSPAGLVPSPQFTCTDYRLCEGVVTLYTDGVTEARGDGGMLGEQRLYDVIRDLPHDPHAQVDGIVASALDYQGGVPSDDIAVVSFAALP